MRVLSDLRFRGEFRDYQSEVLNSTDQYLKDGKLHIVAAPGSGKTTLGMELICRVNRPALILSPTVTIRQQWGERFAESFLPIGEDASDYVSFDLHRPSQITTITYQALYAACNRISVKEESDDEEGESGTVIDFRDFDLLRVIREAGIGTICLDEAHHLKNEWHKALSAFLSALGRDATLISLTATPPYDSTPGEWEKYIGLCGEIDAEIYVPQLVAQKSLCPHQDYVYFNYPTAEEKEIFNQYKQKALTCTETVLLSPLFDELLASSGLLTDFRAKEECILENAKGFIAILCMAKHRSIPLPKALIRLLSPRGRLPAFSLAFAETAFQFVIDSPDIFSERVSTRLRTVLSENGVIEERKVCLQSTAKLNRLLLSSTGKAIGINEIVRSESSNLGKDLRMLILTDYVRNNAMKTIGGDEPIAVMGAVPIFESVRRSCGNQVRLALLTGQVVLIPKDIFGGILAIAEKQGVTVRERELPNTDCLEIVFGGTGKSRVAVITEAFGCGLIQVLVGTKSLLGEGWDSPCINSLILASFVGSFVLSNQMRGRAIRTDVNTPGKVANIWHLVTVEPPFISDNPILETLAKPMLEDKESIPSEDFQTLQRRFECFLAPSYSGNRIENGIERLDIIRPPYNEKGFRHINEQMLRMAADRASVAARWNGTVGRMEVLEADEVPKTVVPRGFLFVNAFQILIVSILFYGFTQVFSRSITTVGLKSPTFASFAITLLVLLFCAYLFCWGLVKIVRYISPRKTIEELGKCVFLTLKDMSEIESRDARVEVSSDNLRTSVYCCLANATLHEKYVFAEAVRELLSGIANPRYVLVKRYRIMFLPVLSYSHSYACPSVISRKKENAEILAQYLSKSAGGFSLVYTRSEAGRKALLKCRKRSYMNLNEAMTKRKKMTNSWE